MCPSYLILFGIIINIDKNINKEWALKSCLLIKINIKILFLELPEKNNL
jgi:hypothetical protein